METSSTVETAFQTRGKMVDKSINWDGKIVIYLEKVKLDC